MPASDSSGRQTAKDCKNRPPRLRGIQPIGIAGSLKQSESQPITSEFYKPGPFLRRVSATARFLHEMPRNTGGQIPPNNACCAR